MKVVRTVWGGGKFREESTYHYKRDRPQTEQSLGIGDSALSPIITASDLYPNSPKEDLPQILCTFNYEKTLITLAWINLLLHRSGTPSERLRFERLLQENSVLEQIQLTPP